MPWDLEQWILDLYRARTFYCQIQDLVFLSYCPSLVLPITAIFYAIDSIITKFWISLIELVLLGLKSFTVLHNTTLLGRSLKDLCNYNLCYMIFQIIIILWTFYYLFLPKIWVNNQQFYTSVFVENILKSS